MTSSLSIKTLRKYASPSATQPSVLAGLSDEQLEQVVKMVGNKSFSDKDIAKQIQRTFKVGLDRNIGTIRNAVFKFRHKIQSDKSIPETTESSDHAISQQIDDSWKGKLEELKNMPILEQQQALILDLWQDFTFWRTLTLSAAINPKHVVDLGRLLKDAMVSYVESLDKFGLIEKQPGQQQLPHTQVNQLFVMLDKNIDNRSRVQDFLTTAQNELELIAETSDIIESPEGTDYEAELQPESCSTEESPGIDESIEQGSRAESERN